MRAIFDGMITNIIVKRDTKRTGAAESRWLIAPTYPEKLEEAKKYYRPCNANKEAGDMWQVKSLENKVYVVHLGNKTSGCKRWNMTDNPYRQAISTIYKRKQHREYFLHTFFKNPMYLEVYSPVVPCAS